MSRAKSLAWIGGVGLLGLTPAALFAQGLPLPPAPDNTVPVQVAPPQTGTADVVQTGGGGERTLRPRDILKDGVENHRKAEFELADVYLKKAQELRGSLSASEQKELDAYLASNNKALMMRKQGVETITKTSAAVNAGKYAEAEALLKSLSANPYLSAQDRQSVAVLKDALARNSANNVGGNGNVGSVPTTVTPKGNTPADMFAAAEEAFKKGNLDEAYTWAANAKAAGYSPRMPWSPSPDKLMAEITAAKKKAGTNASMNANAPADQRQMQAKQLCMQANQALNAGDIATAKKLTQQAKDLKVNMAWFEDYTPEKLEQAIARAEKGAVPSGNKMVVNVPADPRVAVKEAQAALERGELDRAEELCNSARVAKVNWGYFEKTPDSVLVDVRKARETVNGKKAADLLVTARKNLDAGNLDEAEKCVAQSKALKNDYPMWDLTSERPDKLMAEITAKKAVAKRNQPLQPLNDVNNRTVPPVTQPPVTTAKNQLPVPPAATPPTVANNNNVLPPSAPQVSNTVPVPPATVTNQVDPRVAQANRLMAEARMDLNKGMYESALSKAATVKQMGVQTADNPDSILAAVKAVQATRDAKSNPVVADAKRTKALQLMADAKVKMKTGDIMGAHKAVTEAKAMNVVFQQGDELPEAMMAQLQVKAREQVDTYAKAADTLTQRGRTGEAQQYRNYVMNLAMTFNVPAPQMSSTGAPKELKVEVAVTDVSTQGKKLCMDIEQCIREGQLVQARKLANALYEGPYNMKPQAGQFLAQLDAADMKATIKVSEQYYDLVVKAVNRKEYDLAKTYAEKIDRKVLDEAKAKHLNELMSSPVFQAEKSKGVIQMAGGTQDVTGKAAGQSPLLDEVRKKQEIESQRLSELQKLAQAKSIKLAQAGNLDGAIAELKGALETVKKADSDVPKVADMSRQLEMRIKRLEQANEEVTFAKEAKEKLDSKSNAKLRKVADEENRRNQVAALMTECKNLMKEGKYAEAEARAERAHAIDPDNVAIDLARQQARTIKNLTDEELIDKNNKNLFTDAMNGVVNNKVVGDNKPVDYDPSFSRVGAERMRKLAERLNRDKSSENLPTNSRMNSNVSVDFRNKPLIEVVDELRTLSQTNMLLEAFALEYDGVDPKMPISVTLNNVTLRTVLDRVLGQAQLTYYVKDGVINITTKQARASHKVKRSYAVHDLIVPRDDMATLPNLNSNTAVPVSTTGDANNNGFGAGAGREGYNGTPDLKNGQWQTRRTGQTLEKQLMHLITSTIEPESWKGSSTGGNGTIEYYPMGMTLVVSQSSDIQEQIEELIKRLRELQEVQITVEVRILTLTDDFFERMGVDFNVLLPNRNTNFDRQVASGQFAPAGQLNYPNNVNAIVGLTPNGNFTNNLGIPISNDSYNASRLPTGFAGFGPPGATGGLDMGVAFLSSIQVFLVMEAVQGDVRNSTLQAPKITMFNGQAASISSSTVEFFVTQVTSTPNFFTGIPVFTPVNTPIPTGTTLTVQAVVTNDRRYVQLTLQPVISSVTDRSRAFTAVAGITVQQPAISTITLATTVMVPDGGTILVGGLKTMNEQRREFGPPILSKIPYVNRLFRNQSYGKSATSLMFMVTPRIIINEEEEEKLGNTFTY